MITVAGIAIARNVHFVGADGVHCAAIVTRVWDKESGMINCVAFNEWGGQIPSTTSVKFDPNGTANHSWHWPERE